MINPKALYEVKLILDYLPKDEYDLIPKETIEYLENNMVYDENVIINPKIDLDKQNLRDDTYDFLEKIIKSVDMNKAKEIEARLDNLQFEQPQKEYSLEIKKYVEKAKKENKEFDVKIENIRLKKIIESLKTENQKIEKAKILFEEYNNNFNKLSSELDKTKEKYNVLIEQFNRIPKFIKNMFIGKENVKLLNSNN